MPQIRRPAPDEYAPFYAGYVTQAGNGDVLARLGAQMSELETMLASLDDDAAGYRYAPGKWSIKEVVGHLGDAERVFAYRLLRFGRGDTTPLPGFEENSYVAAADFDARSLASLVGELGALRAATLELISGLPAAAWERSGTASGATVSTRALVYILAGHLAHHVRILQERYGLGTSAASDSSSRHTASPPS